MKKTRRGFLGTLAGMLGVGTATKAVESSEALPPVGVKMAKSLSQLNDDLELGAIKAGWVRTQVTVMPSLSTGPITLTFMRTEQ